MAKVELLTTIKAPEQRVFDLARNTDFIKETVGDEVKSGAPKGGLTAGAEVVYKKYIGGGEVTMQTVAFESPLYFAESMTKGGFKRLVYERRFAEEDGNTTMRDSITYEFARGPFGIPAGSPFVGGRFKSAMKARAAAIKKAAESDQYRKYLSQEPTT
ncbi:MAG: SRPBCC family protein [Armatimonadetes bacterium]|nr:SRPBCC family protein [Armatimonadota bacterium]